MLADSTHDLEERLPAGRPFKSLYGVRIAADVAGLLDAASLDDLAIETGLWFDQHGRRIDAVQVWTGSLLDGSPAPACEEWQSSEMLDVGMQGDPGTVLGRYLQGAAPVPCLAPSRLYCVATEPVLFWDNFELLSAKFETSL
jgi:hypothetical protein